VILEVLGWLVVADAVAALLFAGAVYAAGRRSGNPVPPGRAIGIAGCLIVPALLLYAIVWLVLRKLLPDV
jgi:hypothetical protein